MRRSTRKVRARNPVLARIAAMGRSAQLWTLAGVLEDGADRVSPPYRDAVSTYYKRLSDEQ